MSAALIPRAFLAVAVLFVACVVVQFFLAGLGVFESYASFITHRDFGYAFGWLALVLLALAIVGRAPRRQLLRVVAIIVAFAFQSVFVALRTEAPALAALHPLNGVLILLLSIDVAMYAWRHRRDDPRSSAVGAGAR